MIKKAIILAGGQGTRLRPVTLEIPKPLITINRRPIVNYLVNSFVNHGVEEVKIVIRPQDREEFEWWLKRWGGDFKNVKVSFEEESSPMGTFGYWAHHLRNWTGEEPFFLTNGDELKDINLSEMYGHHKNLGALATIALVTVPNPNEYGVAVLENHYISEFLEKPQNPPSNLISSGLYIIDPRSIDCLEDKIKNGRQFLMVEKDLFPVLAKQKQLLGYKANGKWFDCGNLERWEKAIKEWRF